MSWQRDKVVFVSHCIFNQTTRARWRGGGASRERGMLRDIVDVLSSHGMGAIQMECPEFSLFGNPRPPKTKDGYDTPQFREKCGEIAERNCDKMERYLDAGIGACVVAIIGVENSPSCGVSKVTRTVEGDTSSRPGRGHLMDALDEELGRRGIEVPMIGVSLKADEWEDSLRKLETTCSRKDTT